MKSRGPIKRRLQLVVGLLVGVVVLASLGLVRGAFEQQRLAQRVLSSTAIMRDLFIAMNAVRLERGETVADVIEPGGPIVGARLELLHRLRKRTDDTLKPALAKLEAFAPQGDDFLQSETRERVRSYFKARAAVDAGIRLPAGNRPAALEAQWMQSSTGLTDTLSDTTSRLAAEIGRLNAVNARLTDIAQLAWEARAAAGTDSLLWGRAAVLDRPLSPAQQREFDLLIDRVDAIWLITKAEVANAGSRPLMAAVQTADDRYFVKDRALRTRLLAAVAASQPAPGRVEQASIDTPALTSLMTVSLMAADQAMAQAQQQVAIAKWRLFGAITTILLSAIGGFGAIMFLNAQVLEPLSRITAAMGRVAAGDVDCQIADSGRADEVGELARALGVFQENARARLDADRQLRTRNRYLRALFDTLPQSVWLKDTQSRYLAANESCASPFGMTGEELTGKSDFDLRPNGEAEDIFRDDLAVMAARARKTVEHRQAGPAGDIWIETDKAPVFDEDGAVLGTVGVSRDITDRKAAEASREAALDEAVRIARIRSEFIAQVSHELRTPLNAILGYAQILDRDKSLSRQQAKGVSTIYTSGRHLLTLIDDILEMARIESGRIFLSPSEVDLESFIQTVGDIIRLRAEEKGLSFVLQFEPDLPRAVRVDERRLRQVLLNLLGNAVKFTDTGSVTLRVSPGAHGNRETGESAPVLFEIRDTGLGVAPEDIDRIFLPFEQIGDQAGREGGAGLGLAISRELVRMMGGEIKVTSRAGQGSLFSFELELPIAQVAPAQGDEAGRPQAIGYLGPRKRVLVVDDTPANCRMMSDALASFGFDVAEAGNGAEALQVLERWPADLVVMDTMMPDMDGLETTRRLKSSPVGADVCVIAVSASASPEDEARCLASGASIFIPKPVELDRLLRAAAACLTLELICDVQESAAAKSFGDEMVPSVQDLDQVHGIALSGYVRQVKSWAENLARRNAQHKSFADHLIMLADSYQTKAILNYIEQARQKSLVFPDTADAPERYRERY